mmetsp:Transcript_26639/g.48012  ORF Transcript_26639/g.48012 Transcript_26639/m.48012 type:complete len:142 (+) Transcript_26639:2540-2965(+)
MHQNLPLFPTSNYSFFSQSICDTFYTLLANTSRLAYQILHHNPNFPQHQKLEQFSDPTPHQLCMTFSFNYYAPAAGVPQTAGDGAGTTAVSVPLSATTSSGGGFVNGSGSSKLQVYSLTYPICSSRQPVTNVVRPSSLSGS